MSFAKSMLAVLATGLLFVLMVVLFAPRDKQNCQPFTTDYVIDGDTLVTDSGETLRLARIDAPEKGNLGAKAATSKLKEMTDRYTCYVDLGKGEYGRTIADVRVSASDILLEENLANPY